MPSPYLVLGNQTTATVSTSDLANHEKARLCQELFWLGKILDLPLRTDSVQPSQGLRVQPVVLPPALPDQTYNTRLR